MDFTIRLKAEGTDEVRAQADTVRDVRTELEKTQKASKVKAQVPRAIREAKEDRELDRAADKAMKALIKEGQAQERTDAKRAATAERERLKAEAATRREQATKERGQAREAAAIQRKQATEEKERAKQEAADRKAEAARVKADDRKAAQEAKAVSKREADAKKAQEREDKDLARAADRAQKAIIRDEKQAKKDAEKAEVAKIDPRSAMSAIDKAKERVSKRKEADIKQADKDKADKVDPSRKMTETGKIVNEKLYKPLMIGAALVGASLVGAMAKFAPLALGYQGMARLSMVSAQASFNMRRLFMGTNPKPLLDAIQRTGQLLDPRTFTGKALSGLLTRTADGIMASMAKAEPYVRLFFKGMLLGGLQAEGAWLKLRIAVQPLLNMLPKTAGHMLSVHAGAMLVKGSLGLLAVGAGVSMAKAAGAVLTFGRAVLVATGSMLPYVAAFVALAAAIKQAKDLYDAWDENSAKQIETRFEETGLFGEERNAVGAVGGLRGAAARAKVAAGADKPAQMPAPTPPKGAEKQAKPVGQAIGTNLGLGIVDGMKSAQAQVENGARDLVLTAEKGAKDAGEIRSPARRWRREIGRQLGAGAALGLKDSAGAMGEAAAAMVPDAPEVGGAGVARGRITIGQIGPFFGMPPGGETQVRKWVADAVDDMAERLGALAVGG